MKWSESNTARSTQLLTIWRWRLYRSWLNLLACQPWYTVLPFLSISIFYDTIFAILQIYIARKRVRSSLILDISPTVTTRSSFQILLITEETRDFSHFMQAGGRGIFYLPPSNRVACKTGGKFYFSCSICKLHFKHITNAINITKYTFGERNTWCGGSSILHDEFICPKLAIVLDIVVSPRQRTAQFVPTLSHVKHVNG